LIDYLDSSENIIADQLYGFFIGWPEPPTPEVHLRLLRNSDVLAAYIPFLEVLPAYQHQGIGQTLVRRMLTHLQDLYMIDLLCDVDVQSFYEQSGMYHAVGMCVRNFAQQSGQ
jgi:ribosomal protein S18 acetylase RimI-like enzyme